MAHAVEMSLGVNLAEVLGQGSYGSVFRGNYKSRDFAFKLINFENISSKEKKIQRMVWMETVISAKFDHPNLVKTFQYGYLDNPSH